MRCRYLLDGCGRGGLAMSRRDMCRSCERARAEDVSHVPVFRIYVISMVYVGPDALLPVNPLVGLVL